MDQQLRRHLSQLETASNLTAELRERSKPPWGLNSPNRPVAPAQSPANVHPSLKDAAKRRKRKRGSVADAAFVLFKHASSADLLRTPPGFELRLRMHGQRVTGSYWHIKSGAFVSTWFYVLATTGAGWLIAYMPASCERIEAELIAFNEVESVPAVLRKAGCKVGSAPLVVEMMRALIPSYPN